MRSSMRFMRTSTRFPKRLRLPLALLLVAAVVVPAVAVSETPTVEARSTIEWKPNTASINPGGEVKFVNNNMGTHGVEWKSGPGTPSCTGVDGASSGSPSSGSTWNGSCTFAQAGTYVFWCTVHGSGMKGTITVGVPTGPVPIVKKVSPKKGSTLGGTAVSIAGTGFTGATKVMFGAVEATGFSVNSDESITVTSPAAPAGTVDVRITTPGGTSEASKHDHFKSKAPKR